MTGWFFCALDQTLYYQGMNSTTTSSELQDRRDCNRLSCKAPVRVYVDPKSAVDSFFLEANDLSPQGVFLRTDLLFPEGEWLELEFLVPGRALPVRGKGQVVRVHTSYDPPGPGIAVHIPQLTAEERNALNQLNLAALRAEM
jgi:hypothetical protein